jgi:hypothetical protein
VHCTRRPAPGSRPDLFIRAPGAPDLLFPVPVDVEASLAGVLRSGGGQPRAHNAYRGLLLSLGGLFVVSPLIILLLIEPAGTPGAQFFYKATAMCAWVALLGLSISLMHKLKLKPATLCGYFM